MNDGEDDTGAPVMEVLEDGSVTVLADGVAPDPVAAAAVAWAKELRAKREPLPFMFPGTMRQSLRVVEVFDASAAPFGTVAVSGYCRPDPVLFPYVGQEPQE